MGYFTKDTNGLNKVITNNNNLALTNRFMAKFILPPKLISPHNQSELSMLCEEATWPSSYLQTFYYRDHRNAFEVPHSYSMYPIEMTFIVTNNHLAPIIFKQWQNLALDKTTYRLSYRSEYSGILRLSSVNKNNVETRACKISSIYPKSISSMKLDRNRNNDYIKLEVKFVYKDFEELDPINTGFGRTPITEV